LWYLGVNRAGLVPAAQHHACHKKEDIVRRLTVAAALALALIWTSAGWAASSLLGPTGLITIPTADVLGMTQFTVGLTQVWADAHEDETLVYANVGLLPKLEVGFTREDLQDDESETILNAKVRLLGPLPGKITLAAGVMDFTDQIDRTVYVVGSHTLGAGLLTEFGQVTTPQLHVGIGGGRFDGLFAGVSTTVNRKLALMAEYDGDDINLGARLPVAPQVEASAGILNGFDDLALGVQFSSPW
jgi:hypothetical protein